MCPLAARMPTEQQRSSRCLAAAHATVFIWCADSAEKLCLAVLSNAELKHQLQEQSTAHSRQTQQLHDKQRALVAQIERLQQACIVAQGAKLQASTQSRKHMERASDLQQQVQCLQAVMREQEAKAQANAAQHSVLKAEHQQLQQAQSAQPSASVLARCCKCAQLKHEQSRRVQGGIDALSNRHQAVDAMARKLCQVVVSLRSRCQVRTASLLQRQRWCDPTSLAMTHRAPAHALSVGNRGTASHGGNVLQAAEAQLQHRATVKARQCDRNAGQHNGVLGGQRGMKGVALAALQQDLDMQKEQNALLLQQLAAAHQDCKDCALQPRLLSCTWQAAADLRVKLSRTSSKAWFCQAQAAVMLRAHRRADIRSNLQMRNNSRGWQQT
jgi:hypothetical protein